MPLLDCYNINLSNCLALFWSKQSAYYTFEYKKVDKNLKNQTTKEPAYKTDIAQITLLSIWEHSNVT